MKTVILEQPGSLRLTDSVAPGEPGEGQALVRVRRIGICGTDLHAFEGRQNFFTYPRILGHELAVEVMALGSSLRESAVAVGDHCTVYPYASCGQCIACRRGKPNCCRQLEVLGVHVDGGMREHLILPVEKLYPANSLSLDQLALVEMLGVGAHAVFRSGLTSEDTVLVIGAGPIGLSIAAFAHMAGSRVIVMEMSERRIAFCQRHMDVQEVIDARGEPLQELARLTSDDLPTVVFDATGSGRSMTRAFEYTAFGGKLILVGHYPGDITFHDPDFHRRELTLLASRGVTPGEMTTVISALGQGLIHLDPWITNKVHLEDVCEAFPNWLTPNSDVIKAMVVV